MVKITFPNHAFKFKQEDNKEFIFDEIRRRWVRLSPEEWVRQNFIQYLIQLRNVPASLVSVEKEIKTGELKRRYDVVVYKGIKPWLIVECKEMGVPLTDATIQQIVHYNMYLKVDFLVITNGKNTFVFNVHEKIWVDDIPYFANV